MRIAELEELFDKGDFGSGGIEAAECAPIVDNHAGANHVGTAIDSSGSDRYLGEQKGRKCGETFSFALKDPET